MNCRGWNPHLALYVDGDLEQDLTQQLEAHLAVCDECRSFADSLRETQGTFRQVRNDIVETASLNRIRANVLRQVRAIEERRGWIDRLGMLFWSGWSWRYSVLGCVTLIVVSAVAWQLTRLAGPVEPQPRVVANPAPVARPSETESAVAENPRAIAQPGAIAAARVVPVVAEEEVDAPEPVPLEAITEERSTERSNDSVVQFLTEDPNIVIYWLIDPNGGN
jgi:anti-sigma factor RsiW